MEIHFVFDKEEPVDTFINLIKKYSFDSRDGLNVIMLGLDAYEVGDDNRLIHQLERQLDIDLALLDYWNIETHDKYIPIHVIKNVLEITKNRITQQPQFYENIQYDFNTTKQYLQRQFLNDINFLIERLRMNQHNGAQKVKYSVEG